MSVPISNIGLKEWAVAINALETGRLIFLLRKGGILMKASFFGEGAKRHRGPDGLDGGRPAKTSIAHTATPKTDVTAEGSPVVDFGSTCHVRSGHEMAPLPFDGAANKWHQ